MEREAKDRLSDANYRVGFYYFRVKWYTGAIPRFQEILTTDPNYTNRDAVYYHLAESYYRNALQLTGDQATALKAQALPYYERLVKEFEKSEYLPEAQKRIAELKAGS